MSVHEPTAAAPSHWSTPGDQPSRLNPDWAASSRSGPPSRPVRPVRAGERADEDEASELIFIDVFGGSFLNGHQDVPVARSDLEQLAAKGYLHLREPGGTLFVSVTAEGHAYYEDHEREHHPAEQLAARVREYVDTTAAAAYPEAAVRLQEAPEELWSVRRDADVTPVGFKCREALQSFAQAYYARFYPRATDEPIAREKTADMVSKVIRHLQQARGETDTCFDDALYQFWRRLIGLDQKVVHDTTTPDRPLTWEDGRRVLLYSHLVIGELHLLATGDRT